MFTNCEIITIFYLIFFNYFTHTSILLDTGFFKSVQYYNCSVVHPYHHMHTVCTEKMENIVKTKKIGSEGEI